MHMRESRVLRKLRAGQVVSCTKFNLSCPRAPEIAARCGIDCVWLDMEHVPNDLETVENQIRSAKAYDVDAIVRVARGSYSDYIKPLEADAAGIMVPHILSLEDAERVVYQTRFHPLGRRPLDGGNADGAYCLVETEDYLREANAQRFIVLQIEDPEALPELDEIAALEGIDMIFFGPGDFSQGIGAPGQWDHPDITEARKRIARAARAHGKFAGTTGSIESLPGLIDMGYQFICIGGDVVGLGEYYCKISGAFAHLRQTRETSP